MLAAANVALAVTLEPDATDNGVAYAPMSPPVDLRINAGDAILAADVMLFAELMFTEMLPVTVLDRETSAIVEVSSTVLALMVPVELVRLVAAVIWKSPSEAAVPACELPLISMVPGEDR